MSVSISNNNHSVSYSDIELEEIEGLESISSDEAEDEFEDFVQNLMKEHQLSNFDPLTHENDLSDRNITDKTPCLKEYLETSLKENQNKLSQSESNNFKGVMGLGAFQFAGTSGAVILAVTLTSLSILSNPIGLIVGGAALLLAGLAGLGYGMYCLSKRLSEQDKQDIQQENKNLTILLHLMNNDEEFRKHMESLKLKAPLPLDVLMNHAKPFLPKS